ncbi:RNA-binding, RBD [Glarea lozoyensis ATCC 20868]|uniref:U4/U6 snRNA-associated-splicing factor PRP24 n=1 Tax=Glarea lozoyensis (strain ATCC 20868 / MF5171) TaxID=1116229 RepID=S3CQ50_GLAL2|nr:RNA-binding, RBD [Glarea lozoyensis ATCC 20868]EPE28617.1 RNA-binding, RBD [Glarea lozoyensis ATCC 20868]
MADPVGEESWLGLIDEASRRANDLEQRVEVLEIYKRAIAAEPFSNKLWLAYCEWYWSLYSNCQNGDTGWSEEEQEVGKEVFTLLEAIMLWSQGAEATKYRLNDSHIIWNRWMGIELEEHSKSPNPESFETIKSHFLERLQIPHATWDETSEMFSSFITTYDEESWESTMMDLTKLAQPAKDLYSSREMYELKLNGARGSNDSVEEITIWKEYLNWERAQCSRKSKKGSLQSPPMLCVALFERALCSTTMGVDPEMWEDYITFLSTTELNISENNLPSALSVLQRATAHCPFSGGLWSRYILDAEAHNFSLAEMEQIKTDATAKDNLTRDNMEAMVEFYVTWATFLKRKALSVDATDEDLNAADKGLPAALKTIDSQGQRKYGRSEWNGDPLYRIERVFIEYKTQKGSIQDARIMWQNLVKRRGDSYEFWQHYYFWEMAVRESPSHSSRATEVLEKAVYRQGLDWPEKILEMYLRHCQNYEQVEVLLKAMNLVYKVSKSVTKRRAKEAAQASAMYAHQPQAEVMNESSTPDAPSSASKRKRETDLDDVDENASKRTKNEFTAAESEVSKEQNLKRDRENTTVMVTNLPVEATQTKVRQYFKEYGHINSLAIKPEPDKGSATAVIEFRSPLDVQSALLRDMKYFVDRQIRVQPATGQTLYVCNFPPTADDAFFRKLFKDCGEIFSIRWPSLKYNTTRRFVYVTFRTREAAAAATRLDGEQVAGQYKLVAKYSDPGAKKEREGAMAEEREVHVTGIDFSLNERDLKEIFGKYGTVDKVRLLKKPNGESKGAGFISFEKKGDATAALVLDKTKVKSRVLTVEVSLGKNYKPTATNKGQSMSPAPDADGDSVMSVSPRHDGLANTHAQHAPAPADNSNRTITLMNIPDTVNDARVRAVVEPYGALVKVVLRPDHQGAIIEYVEVASAGKAALALEGHEIVPGKKLRTGGLKDLFAERGEKKIDKILIGKEAKKAPATFMQPAAPIRRPGAGGRGGLGMKRGLGYAASQRPAASEQAQDVNNGNNGKGTKSNADFRALFENTKKD